METLGFDALVVGEDAEEGVGAATFEVDDEGAGTVVTVFWVEEDAVGVVEMTVC